MAQLLRDLLLKSVLLRGQTVRNAESWTLLQTHGIRSCIKEKKIFIYLFTSGCADSMDVSLSKLRELAIDR